MSVSRHGKLFSAVSCPDASVCRRSILRFYCHPSLGHHKSLSIPSSPLRAVLLYRVGLACGSSLSLELIGQHRGGRSRYDARVSTLVDHERQVPARPTINTATASCRSSRARATAASSTASGGCARCHEIRALILICAPVQVPALAGVCRMPRPK